MNNKSYTEEVRENIKNGWRGFQKWLDDHDSGAWPAFLTFFAVVTAGMIFNVDAFAPVVGLVASIAIGSFFEYAILAWKITTNRKRNDAKQNQIAYWALWLSVILALTMLVVNMFRIGGEQGFEVISYIIVGITAGVQLIGYLLFDGADPDKKMRRDHSQNERGMERKDQEANFVISEVQADARIIRRIGDELSQIRRENSDLPTELMEPLLEAARQKLLANYSNGSETVEKATRGMSDVNGDGKIGRGGSFPPGMQIPEVRAMPNHDTVPFGSPKKFDGVVTKYDKETGDFEIRSPRDLEELKELPIETLFEDEVPLTPPQSATIDKEDDEPDF